MVQHNIADSPKPVVERRAHIGVECPTCHGRHFMEIQIDDSILNSRGAKEIEAHLQAWLASRCPNHLGPVLEMSKN